MENKSTNKNGYELIDSGGGMKLERFGQCILARPEPEALWHKSNARLWENIDAIFETETDRKWKIINKKMPQSWVIEHGGIQFKIALTSFKHTGIFPEQIDNWDYIRKNFAGKNLKVLNLFGYTGGASLAAAMAGNTVLHIDSSPAVNNWMLENAKLNKVPQDKIRFLTDDAFSYVRRALKRGETFDLIILDPPAFGHGIKKSELWKIENDLPQLLDAIGGLLSKNPAGIIISGYAAGYSKDTYTNLLMPFTSAYGGSIEAKDMSLVETSHNRKLTIGIVARWKK